MVLSTHEITSIHLKVANESREYKCNYLCGQIALRGVLQAGVSYNVEVGS